MSRQPLNDPPRGFSEFNADEPLRDFMATYFDRDDDVTRGQVLDFLDRIVSAQSLPVGDDSPSLDAAWNAAEDALPKGWWVVSFEHDPDAPNYRAAEKSGTPHVYGPWTGTPAAALLALLREFARLSKEDTDDRPDR